MQKIKRAIQKTLLLFFIISSSFFFLPSASFAHPGNTASDGCHYCRTNCDSWGETWNARHCHGGYKAPKKSYTQPTTPTCPSNATYSSSEKACVCHSGYAPFSSSQACIKIPKNAHAVTSKTDAWLCDEGYSEKGNSCIKDIVSEEIELVPSLSVAESTEQKTKSEESFFIRFINFLKDLLG